MQLHAPLHGVGKGHRRLYCGHDSVLVWSSTQRGMDAGLLIYKIYLRNTREVNLKALCTETRGVDRRVGRRVGHFSPFTEHRRVVRPRHQTSKQTFCNVR